MIDRLFYESNGNHHFWKEGDECWVVPIRFWEPEDYKPERATFISYSFDAEEQRIPWCYLKFDNDPDNQYVQAVKVFLNYDDAWKVQQALTALRDAFDSARASELCDYIIANKLHEEK